MKQIVLISCASNKKPFKSKAKDLYTSPLFVSAYKYAESLKPEHIFILSAKYGLLDIDTEIEPYNKTLNNMPIIERKEWAARVLDELKTIANLDLDLFIFLAGNKYREFLVPYLKNYEIPLEGLSIGKQLKFLKEKML